MAKTPNAPTNMSFLFTRRRFFEATRTPAPAALRTGAMFPTIASSDNVAPSIPLNINATAVSTTQINVSWSASTDTGGSGLAGYRVYRDGSATALTSTTSTSISDTGLTQATQYSYRVTSYDNAGNESALSSAATATTQSPVTAGSPLILGMDFIDGPTTGGENNLGWCVTIFGTNLGSFSDYGVIGTRHVTIGGIEVANYRVLDGAASSGTGQRGYGVYDTMAIQALTFQLGALGSPTPGVPLRVDIVDNTNTSICANAVSGGFLRDLKDNALSFIVQPGTIYQVSLSAPNDSTSGLWGSPKRHLQVAPGGSFTGAVFGPGSPNNHTDTNRIAPGSCVMIMPGEWGGDASFGGRWCDFMGRTGLAPTGAAGTGYIKLMGYPGAAGANSRPVTSWNGVNGTNGAFNFCDTQRSSVTNVYGTIGYCKYIAISGLELNSHPNSGVDGAPINHQVAADFCRVHNCKMKFPSTLLINNGTEGARAGGIAGHGSSRKLQFNYIYDVFDASGAQQNHGIYLGNSTGSDHLPSRADYHTEISFNCIRNCTGGQGIMCRGLPAGAPADSAPYLSVHHNWVQDCGKHGIEFFDLRGFGEIWANVVINCGFQTGQGGSPIYTDCDNVTAAAGIKVMFNTLVGWRNYAGLYQHGGSSTGSIHYEGNIVVQLSGAPATGFDFFLNWSGSPATFRKNLYFNFGAGTMAKPSADTSGVIANPLFTDIVNRDLTPQAGSPALNAALSPSVTYLGRDLFLNARPIVGATNYALGAIERVT